MISWGVCEKGYFREENQDAVLIRHEGNSGLFIVADGVGGCSNGMAASNFLVQSFEQWWDDYFVSHKQLPFMNLFETIKFLVEEVNERLCSDYGSGNCCTTVALLFIHKFIYGYLSSGDSRIYLCDYHGTKQITRDDTWENQPNAAQKSIHNGKLVSAVGSHRYLEYACATNRLIFGMSFLLCSDGIYKFVKQDFIEKQLKHVKQKLFFNRKPIDLLVRTAIENKTDDNYSLIIVKV